MKTSNEINKLLENRIITEKIKADCIKGLSCRITNCIAQEREYDTTKCTGEFAAAAKEERHERRLEFLEFESILLANEEALEIVKTKVTDYERIFEDDDRYYQILDEDVKLKSYIWNKDKTGHRYFKDISSETEKYYLVYIVDDTFIYYPINCPENYPDLDVEEVDAIDEPTCNSKDQSSLQMIRKVVKLMQTGDYQYVRNAS